MYDTPRCAAMLHSLDQLPSTFSFMYCFGEQPFSLYYFQSHECTKVVLWGMAEVGELQHRSCPDTPWYCRAGLGALLAILTCCITPSVWANWESSFLEKYQYSATTKVLKSKAEGNKYVLDANVCAAWVYMDLEFCSCSWSDLFQKCLFVFCLLWYSFSLTIPIYRHHWCTC